MNILDNTLNQLSKIQKINQIEINHDLRKTFNTHSQIEFKTAMF